MNDASHVPLSRRMFLALGAGVVAAACSSSDRSGDESSSSNPTFAVDLDSDPFTLGVASGDPAAASVVIWTRLAPDPLNGGGMPAEDVGVTWEVADTDAFETLVASGVARAEARHGHSVHVDVSLADRNADADPWVFYRFRVGSWTSPVGRTRCAPGAESTEPMKMAAASCQNWTQGYYSAYRDMVEQSPDLVLFLGDYIYEGGEGDLASGSVRLHNSDEVVAIDEYRNRYALYRSDPLLRAAHAMCPWVVIWDDHEVENNYAALTPQGDGGSIDVDFAKRRADAYQVWWEHMPVRVDAPVDGSLRIHRQLSWGSLFEMVALDGRQYRDDQACGDAVLQTAPACDDAAAESRSMLGTEQEKWVVDSLAASDAIWNVVANQTVMSDIRLGEAVLNFDQWDGYAPSRERILSGLSEAGVDNLVVLTGDIHLAGIGRLTSAAKTDAVLGIEFVTTSISSNANVPEGSEELFIALPTIVDAEIRHRGYTLHTVTTQTWNARYRIVGDSAKEDSPVSTWKTFEIRAGTPDVAAI